MPKEHRRLAAILFADVVGYSHLVGKDEAAIISRVLELRENHLAPIIEGFGGRIFKNLGDGVAAEFKSSVDALSAAILVQQAMSEDQSGDPNIIFRVGLHSGDVIVDSVDGDLYGEVVNVAARLEGVAPAGGIVISQSIYDSVIGRLKASFEEIAIPKLKNIEKPPRVYKVSWQSDEWREQRKQRLQHDQSRRFSAIRNTLSEFSQNALADIHTRIGEVSLKRHRYLSAVRAALVEGRYVEICGDAGVGKSAILKCFAEEVVAPVIALRPGRTPAKGWTAMRSVLGFNGTARDMLGNVAGQGKCFLLVDNLEAFTDDEKVTVCDLLREAANMPNVLVVATTRAKFGSEETEWLPRAAILQLGQAEPVVVSELDEAEVQELQRTAPELAALLAESSPTRAVARNLFRLGRVAGRPVGEPLPFTEIDLAEQWWMTADGKVDGGHRERARLLRQLAERGLVGVGPWDLHNQPATPIDALVKSETLTDLGGDQITFRHDVLHEWAIANLLFNEPERIGSLPLTRPAAAKFARAFELVSRMTLERPSKRLSWSQLLTQADDNGVHGSWRRAVLLAVVRSEIGIDLLRRNAGSLLEHDAALLRELIRLVMAVDVVPAKEVWSATGMDLAVLPENLNTPKAPSWYRLISWLLELGDEVPILAVPDVAALYTAWCKGLLGLDLLTPKLLIWLEKWLDQLEAASDAQTYQGRIVLFGGRVSAGDLKRLEDDLRFAFVLFSYRVPATAKAYLEKIHRRRKFDEIASSILKVRGSLARAAPMELANLVAAALIPYAEKQKSNRHRDEPFKFTDHEFLPASPAQGPFLELLTYGPQYALPLIRKLVDCLVAFVGRAPTLGDEEIVIEFPQGARSFPLLRSYGWSRGHGNSYAVTSALMALEAWAHTRIEAGDSFEAVLSEVLGAEGSPAAYLQVAVDLVISHWPKSRDQAVYFAGAPELLCLDRERLVHDQLGEPDFLGLGALQEEPPGLATLASLKRRPSRKVSLDELLGRFAIFSPESTRDLLIKLLEKAGDRLGPPASDSSLSDPALMARHALNRANPENWTKDTITLSDGTQEPMYRYTAPLDEERHFAELRKLKPDPLPDLNMELALAAAIEDPARSSAEFSRVAVEWAKRQTVQNNVEEADSKFQRESLERAILIAAALVARDGDAELQLTDGVWAHDTLMRALETGSERIYIGSSGLRYNAIGIAFVGLVHEIGRSATFENVRLVLDAVSRGEAQIAAGLKTVVSVLEGADERLPRAVLRCAFAGCIRPSLRGDLSKEMRQSLVDQQEARRLETIDAEMAWLYGRREESSWPTFSPPRVRARRGVVIGGEDIYVKRATPLRPPAEYYIDHQGAAHWLKAMAVLFDVSKRPWLKNVCESYSTWTAEANGKGLDQYEEVSQPPWEWNEVYFDLLARCLVGFESAAIDEVALLPIKTLPDRSFFDVIARFIRSVDAVFFGGGELDAAEAVRIRTSLARKLQSTGGWRRLAGSSSSSIEMHIGPAIAVLFFNDFSHFQGAKAYLLPLGVGRLGPFLPLMKELGRDAPNLFVALVVLNVVEVSPRPEHLSLIVELTEEWLDRFPNDRSFWIDHDVGNRCCALLDAIRLQAPMAFGPNELLRGSVERALANLVRLGVAAANRLEAALVEDAKRRDE